MAIPWLKIETTLPDKPEVVQISAILGIDQDAVVGKLVRVWAWADSNSIDGNAMTVTSAFLDRLSLCPGFAQALRQVGWLEGREGLLSFPRFDRHNGQSAKSRAQGNNRQERLRSQVGNAASVTKASPDKIRIEDKKESESGREDVAAVPGRCESAEAAIAHGKTLMPPVAEDFCRAWWEEMESAGWIDRHQRPVGKWKHALSSAWRNSLHRQHEQQARSKGFGTPSTPRDSLHKKQGNHGF